MKRLTLIALCTLFYPACGTTGYNSSLWGIRQCGPTFYTYDVETDPQQREQIRAAFGYFNAVLERQLWIDAGPTTRDVEPSDAISRVQFQPEIEPNSKSQVCGKTHIDWRASSCIVNVIIKLSEECEQNNTIAAWQTKLRHEVGHASGLINHNEDPSGLMHHSSPSIGDTPRSLSDEELTELIGLYP